MSIPTVFVEISLRIPANNGILTYHIPADSDIPDLGARVLVYIRGRSVIGYVINIHNKTPEFKTSPIIKILDPVPMISESMVTLALKTAKAFAATPGEVLNCMLPSGIKQTVSKQVFLNNNINISPEQNSEDILWLKNNGPCSYESFRHRFNLKDSHIKKLLKDSIIEVRYSLSEQQKAKVIRVLKLNEEIPIEVRKLTPKEKIIIETLSTFASAPTASMLTKKAGTSSAPINQLKKKGIIIEAEERLIREVGKEDYYKQPAYKIHPPTEEQTKALEAIKRAYRQDKKPVLIRGVTCSGKTEVYMNWVSDILNENKAAIILVPEIALTPQMLKRFTDRFGHKVAILHSKLSDGERFDQWENIRTGKTPVVIGARSAVFAPVPNLGTIILDEEGEPSFKQGSSPRYHAREVANMRCQLEDALLVMGSATPTIDSYENCLQGKYNLVEMNSRVSGRVPPRVQVVDMREELVTKKNRSIFSKALSNAIKETLAAKKQIILYLNRRGFSSFVFCRECGEPIMCPKCKVSMTYHDGSKIMRCHYCGSIAEVPTVCPKCGSKAIKFFGAGTQRVEAEAKRYFPNARIQRLDSDCVTTKGSLEEIQDRFRRGETDILIGTQMVAKGLDFPNVTLVGILAADSLLRIPDFRSSERNFALLAQVSGRVGRGDTPGNVILQTYSPEHHSIKHAVTEDYIGFFKEESQMRKEAMFPPFIELAYFVVSGPDINKTLHCAEALREELLKCEDVDPLNLFGPAPACIEKKNNKYRFQLMLKMKDIDKLAEASYQAANKTKKPSETQIAIDIDPFFIM